MLRFLLGVLMAIVGSIGTERVTVVAVPWAEMTPAKILPKGTAPSGGAVADGTTFPETNFEMEVESASGNERDISGALGAVPLVTGSPTDSAALTLATSIPGTPGTTARYTYSYTDSAGTSHTVGANEPYVYQQTTTLRAATSGTGYQNPKECITPDGVKHSVYEDWGSRRIQYARWPESTWSMSTAVTIWTQATSFGSTFRPSPTIWWVKSATASGYTLYVGAFYATASGQSVLRMSASKDGGTTWRSWNSDLTRSYSGSTEDYNLEIAWDDQHEQLTAVFVNETTGPAYSLKTYISQGATGASWRALPDGAISDVRAASLVSKCGVFYLATNNGSNDNIAIYRRASTDIDWTAATTDTAMTADNAYRMALVVNDSGWLYLVARNDADEDEILMQVSVNGGTTWGDPSGTHPWQDGGQLIILDDDADSGTTSLTNGILITGATWGKESLWLAGTLITSATTVDNSCVSMQFGGLSNITQNSNPSGVDTPLGVGSLPQDKSPQYAAFTTSGATTQTIELDSSNRLVYALSNDNSTGTDSYSPVGDPSVSGGIWILGKDSAGGTTSGLEFAISSKCHNDGATTSVHVAVFIDYDNGAIQAWDVYGAANIGTAGAFDETKDLAVMLAVDGEGENASLYIMQPGDKVWTSVVETSTLTSTAGAANSLIQFGKIQASTANIDTLDFIPFGSASTGFVADLAAGDFPAELVPIRATDERGAQRLHTHDVWIRWKGAPLHSGDSHTASTVSRTPLSRLSPFRSSPSPTDQYVGPAGSAGATYRLVYDLGSGVETRITNQLLAVMWANLGPVEAVRIMRWSGSAWGNELSVAGYEEPFGAAGAVAFQRGASPSIYFLPNGANGNPQYVNMSDWVGRWVGMGIAGQQVLAQMKRVEQGQFSTTTGVMQAAIELDLDTITAISGSFSGIGSSTTAGTFKLYADDGIGLAGGQGQDTVRYYAIEVDLASGATIPKGGLLTAGSAYILQQPERDGSSIRWISPDELEQMQGSGYTQAQRVRRRAQRVLELPYDSIFVQPGFFSGAGTDMRVEAITGTTPRAVVSNTLQVLRSIQDLAGQQVPVWVAPFVNFASTDPSSSNKGVYGRSVMVGTLPREFDITAGRGRIEDTGSHGQQGGRLLIAEMI